MHQTPKGARAPIVDCPPRPPPFWPPRPIFSPTGLPKLSSSLFLFLCWSHCPNQTLLEASYLEISLQEFHLCLSWPARDWIIKNRGKSYSFQLDFLCSGAWLSLSVIVACAWCCPFHLNVRTPHRAESMEAATTKKIMINVIVVVCCCCLLLSLSSFYEPAWKLEHGSWQQKKPCCAVCATLTH